MAMARGGAAGMSPPLQLSADEIAHFMDRGYVIKRNCLDTALLRQATDRWWATNQIDRLCRDQPASWLEGFSAAESSADDHNQRNGSSWRCRLIANEPLVLDLLPRRLFPVSSSSGTVLAGILH